MAAYTIDVTSDSRFPVNRKRIRTKVASVLENFGLTGSVAVSVRIVGDRKMRQLNKSYRKIDKTTDVLSFPTESVTEKSQEEFQYPEEEALPLGDIVISYPKARLQAAERNVLVDDEIDTLIEHGTNSLLGKHE